jgi:hypothetical protein
MPARPDHSRPRRTAHPPPTATPPSRTGRRPAAAGALLLAALVLTACTAGPNTAVDAAAASGFWWGLWHGLISPITFVVSLFTDAVNVYEVHNTGNWYDFGFIAGVSVAFSGPAASRRSPRRRS